MAAAPFNESVILRVTSLFALFLNTVHVADDIARGIDRFGIQNLFGVLIFLVWLYGTVMLADRRSGLVIMLLGAIFATAMPVLHMRGMSAATLAKSSGPLIYIWMLFALGVSGTFATILAVRGLWRSRGVHP
jgi:hypothetical protein